MSWWERLYAAQTETEFFVLLCDLTHVPTDQPLRAELASVREGDNFALRLTIRQGMTQRVASGQVHLLWVATHIFTLSAHDPLICYLENGKVLTGLDSICAYLKQRHETFYLSEIMHVGS